MAASYLKPEKERIPELICEKRGGGVTYVNDVNQGGPWSCAGSSARVSVELRAGVDGALPLKMIELPGLKRVAVSIHQRTRVENSEACLQLAGGTRCASRGRAPITPT